MYIYSSSTYTQTGTFAWGILVIIQSNECDQWVHVSYFIPPLSEIYIYVVTLYISSIYLVPGVYTTAWQALNRCVFQYKQTKTWRANKEDSKCLTQHEKFQKKWYLCISRRIIGLLTSDIYEGVHACHFTLYFWHLVKQRRFNLNLNVKFFQKQINVFFF